jgi:radical SAM superfamily enzyme YgiQ (UPF0313 family)
MIILIHPPVVKPCEPPAGIAKLSAALEACGIGCEVVDANLEGLIYLSGKPKSTSDTWTSRAVRNLSRNLSSLGQWPLYANMDRYKRAVADVNRVLEISGASSPVRVSLGNYQHRELSPVRSVDLIRASERPEENPFYGYFARRFDDLIRRASASHIGFSLNFLNQALCAFAMIGYLRREHPGIKVVLGGGLVTSWMRRPGWSSPFEGLVHHMVDGPGEDALLSILGAETERAGHTMPDYRSFSLSEYLAPGVILPYSTSSGCYWNKCSFCPERAEGNPYAPVSRDLVVADLRELVIQTRPTLIHLLDNAVSPSLMKALIDHPPGPPWYGFARITHHLADPDFCSALKRSGCVMLKLGLESGDQGVLDHEQKGIDLQMASRALETLARCGIATYVYLLFGTPSETLTEARKTLDFTVSHIDTIGYLNLAIFNLPAYGPENRDLETRELYEGDLSLYAGFVHPRGWERGSVRRFLDKEFKRHRAVADVLRRDPPLFTSNHAPLFCCLSKW